MESASSSSQRRPLVVGRVTRIVFGVMSFVLVALLGTSTLGGIGAALLVLLGVSFIVGGLIGNPGCEITAIPNLVLPKSKRVHCY